MNKHSRRDALGLLAAAGSVLPPLPAFAADDEKGTYDQDSVLKEANAFFGNTTEGLAKVIEKAFQDQGRPNAYIKGEEVAGAISVGLRYGDGQLTMKSGGGSRVFWAGPSIGFQ